MTDHLMLAPRRSSGVMVWVETIGLTLLAVGLGYWNAPGDPLQIYAGFAWTLFAPLLLSVRYGFLQGIASAALLVAIVLVLYLGGYADYQQLPAGYMVGVLVAAMIVGEFRDLWARRLGSLQRSSDYREVRLEEFTRAHQLLRISHDRLAQRLAGNDHSLRSVLLAMRQRMRQAGQGQLLLENMAEAILDLFSYYGPLRQAGLYRVVQGRIELQPLALIGELRPISDSDALVAKTLQQGELISVRPELLEQGEISTNTHLLAGIPLVDTHGNIHALILVENMPFFSFNDTHLNLLAILGGHVGDLLANNELAVRYPDVNAQRFAQLCERSLVDAQHFDIPAFLLAIELPDSVYAKEVEHLLQTQQRGLDMIWMTHNRHGVRLALVLLPLTAEDGLGGYLERIRLSVLENLGVSLEAAGMLVHQHRISSAAANDERVMQFLDKECALDEFQVAIH